MAALERYNNPTVCEPNSMRTDLFDYTLPPELIAQTPLARGESRLLVLHRADGRIEHRRFPDLLEYLDAGDTLVLNDTRVIARRLVGELPTGKQAEILLLHPTGERQWTALVRPGRALRVGRSVALLGPETANERITVQVVELMPDGARVLEFDSARERDAVASWGVSPLPPYIQTALPPEQEERYQTVYSRHDGSAAAPTAGLHFTSQLLEQAQAKGVAIAHITLHVGVDTFRPVRVEDTAEHEMHGEWLSVSPEAAEIINRTPGRIVAVGTTSVRALESAANAADNSSQPERVVPFTDSTRLFITPGYRFHGVDALVTNFHLPRSTLLMLISALAGREYVMNAYAEAVRERYRFYSFGDAMLII
jgi:S-adenosylmethionine:tRNA ribosyltransferase-isomerase